MRLISFEQYLSPREYYPHLRLLEIHHFYWGLMAACVSWVAIFKLSGIAGDITAAVCGINGLWWMADDLMQHYRQRRDLNYKSPVHRLWEWMVKH